MSISSRISGRENVLDGIQGGEAIMTGGVGLGAAGKGCGLPKRFVPGRSALRESLRRRKGRREGRGEGERELPPGSKEEEEGRRLRETGHERYMGCRQIRDTCKAGDGEMGHARPLG